MTDQASTPIVVNANAGILDTIYAALRYLTVLAASIPILMQLLGTRDVTAIVAYFQDDGGKALIAAAVGLGTLAWGLFKTHKRGAQVATVGASSLVPNTVAKLK